MKILKCRPGDLAIKVGKDAGDTIPIGAIVEVREFAVGRSIATGERMGRWIVNYPAAPLPPGEHWACRDEHLRPLRPGDGEDETLTWAGKPEGVAA